MRVKKNKSKQVLRGVSHAIGDYGKNNPEFPRISNENAFAFCEIVGSVTTGTQTDRARFCPIVKKGKDNRVEVENLIRRILPPVCGYKNTGRIAIPSYVWYEVTGSSVAVRKSNRNNLVSRMQAVLIWGIMQQAYLEEQERLEELERIAEEERKKNAEEEQKKKEEEERKKKEEEDKKKAEEEAKKKAQEQQNGNNGGNNKSVIDNVIDNVFGGSDEETQNGGSSNILKWLLIIGGIVAVFMLFSKKGKKTAAVPATGTGSV